MAAEFQNLRVEIGDDRIATVTIDRPSVLNALDDRTVGEIDAAFTALADPAKAPPVPLGIRERLALAPAGYDSVSFSQLSPFGLQLLRVLEQDDLGFGEVPEQVLRAMRTVVELLDDHGLDYVVAATRMSGQRGIQRTIW